MTLISTLSCINQRDKNLFLYKPLGETLHFVRNDFFIGETKTTIENCGFYLVPISIEFCVRNIYHHHVSGNNDSRTGTTPTTCSRNKGGMKKCLDD